MTIWRAIGLGLVLAAIAAFFLLDLDAAVSMAAFQARHAALDGYVSAHAWRAALLFVGLYVALTALSLPGATVMTLVGGALFGFPLGLVLVSFASSIGATLAFLAARFLLRDWVQARFGRRLARVNDGMARDGAFYLFALRLVPLFPFWLVNLAMGLTPIRTWTFYWVSQVGMLAGTAAFVYAGTQLGRFTVGPGLLAALAVLGVFPLIARRVLDVLKRRRLYAPWANRRPRTYDYNLVVIGAGSAGLVAAYIAAATRARVALVEQHRMGGDCLHTGCVPSKALIRTTTFLAQAARAQALGVTSAEVTYDFADVMARVRRVIRDIEPHDSPERYTGLGVEVVQGRGTVTSPWTVDVTTPAGVRTLTTRAIVIAAGARPRVPTIDGLEEAGYVTSDTVWDLRERPRRLLVLGGGPIGCELAQAFARLGCAVTLVEQAARLLAREDPEVSRLIASRFAQDGIRVLTGHTAIRVLVEDGGKVVVAACDGVETRVGCDVILVAVGRVPNVAGYGLEALGIATAPAGTVDTNEFLQTIYPNILACGDVAGPFQFTHTASHQAWYAAVNGLFGDLRSFRADYRAVPRSTFVDPEVARVGLNEQEASHAGVPHVVTTYDLADLDRAIADEATTGFVKILTRPGSDRILGVTIVGAHAGDLLAEYVLAMQHGLGLNQVLRTIHTYPTMAEANRQAAGAWRRGTVTEGQRSFLAAFHDWRRGAGSLAAVVRGVRLLITEKAQGAGLRAQGGSGRSGPERT